MLIANEDILADKAALICDGKEVSYREFWDAVRRISSAIVSQSQSNTDRIGILVSDKALFLQAFYGVLLAGRIAVPLDARDLTLRQYVVNDTNPLFVVSDRALERSANQEIAPNAEEVDIRRVLSVFEPIKVPIALANDDPALILYTSGTSGTPKGVIQSVGNLLLTAGYIRQVMDIQSDIKEYVSAPIDHAFGLGRCRTILACGGTVVLHNGAFDPIRVISSLKKYQCNALSGVSTAFVLLAKYFERELRRLSAFVKWIEIGSLPLTRETKELLCDIFPAAKLVMNYGMTEAMRITMIDFNSQRSKIDSVGQASPGNEIRIVDSLRNALPTGEAGSIETRGGNVAMGYWNLGDAWKARYREGWLSTGDTGRMDELGYLTFVGREDDIINVGGEKFAPMYLESLLKPLFQEHEFYVCGVDDPEGMYGEVPVICMERSEKFEPNLESVAQGLQAAALNKIAVPRAVLRVGTYPKTTSGKIKRKELKAEIAAAWAVRK